MFNNLLKILSEDIISFKRDSHLENDPRRGMSVRWLAGFTVTIKLELLATIISVTWKEVIKSRCEFISHTSGLLTAFASPHKNTQNCIRTTGPEILLK